MEGNALKKTVVITSIVAVVSLLIAGIIGAIGGVNKTSISLGFLNIGSTQGSGVSVNARKSLPLEKTDRIEVGVVSTDVVIRAGEGDSIEAWFHGTVSAPSPDNIPHLRVDRRGNTVRAIVEWKNRPTTSGWRGDTILEVSVPSKYTGALSAESVSGDMKLEDHDYEQLMLKTTPGDIEVDSVKAARLDARTTSGDASVRKLTTEHVEFYSVSGDVDMRAITGDARVHTTSGDVELSFARAPGTVAVETISGDVRLRMPSDAGFTLDARSTSGEVTCDFPITITGSHKGVGENSLAGQVGSSKGNITVRTLSGDIGINR